MRLTLLFLVAFAACASAQLVGAGFGKYFEFVLGPLAVNFSKEAAIGLGTNDVQKREAETVRPIPLVFDENSLVSSNEEIQERDSGDQAPELTQQWLAEPLPVNENNS